MALKNLIGEVRSQFIFVFVFIFLFMYFFNIVKDIYLPIYLIFIYFLQFFCFSFKTLPEHYKPVQDTKTHSMPRLIFYASHLHTF